MTEQFITNKLSMHAHKMGRAQDITNQIAFVSIIFVMVALGFFIVATYVWLAKNYQTDMAAAITGFIALFAAFIMGLVALAIMHYKQRSMKKLRHEVKESMTNFVESVDEVLGEPIKENPKIAALVALSIGFILGEKTF